ncbi:hypothetical protein AAF712_010040 [Marasmius tenuissimus]|uniref:Uncharacterized protein n=1 Tax=Marasmius tenuissimus TaxID=585030 RepID=A0ABR2ZRZ7_9AGAR
MSSSLARAATRRVYLHSTRNYSSIAASAEHVDLASTTDSSTSSRRILENPVPSSSRQPPVSLQTPVRFPYSLQFEETLRSQDPERIWAHYVDLTRVGPSTLPRYYHQQVLKFCIPSPQELRRTSAFRNKRSPHPAEGRLQTIIGNIRAVGRPGKADYHLVLEQFAAVGHHFGALSVFREMAATGTNPSASTYLLILQAIAHRLTLPEAVSTHKERASTALEMLNELIKDMRKRKIPFTPGVFDLSVRIVKDAGDMASFEEMIKLAYGIDMSNPDHLPLESVGLASPSLSMTDSDPLPFVPLSTDALNTILNAYGSKKNVPKLVQAFEVLTAPLPASPNDPLSSSSPSSFDDDDFGGIIDTDTSPNNPPPFVPSARPNTTSFSIMLRWLCKADEVHLSRHYFFLAMHYDRKCDRAAWKALRHKHYWEIPAPDVMIDGHMVASVLRVGRRNHRVGLIRWVRGLIPQILQRKRQSIKFYRHLRWKLAEENEGMERSTGDEGTECSTGDEGTEGSIADVGETFLDLDKQIRLLKKDLADIKQVREYAAYLHGREREYLKDRLGRRVWRGKNTFRSSTRTRKHTAKEKWPKEVYYKPIVGMAKVHIQRKRMDRDLSRRNIIQAKRARRLGSDFFTSKRAQLR